MLAESVHVPVVKLDPRVEQAFNAVLDPLGVKALGARAGDELIVKVFNKDRASIPNFSGRLLEALEREPARPYWMSTFSSVTYI